MNPGRVTSTLTSAFLRSFAFLKSLPRSSGAADLTATALRLNGQPSFFDVQETTTAAPTGAPVSASFVTTVYVRKYFADSAPLTASPGKGASPPLQSWSTPSCGTSTAPGWVLALASSQSGPPAAAPSKPSPSRSRLVGADGFCGSPGGAGFDGADQLPVIFSWPPGGLCVHCGGPVSLHAVPTWTRYVVPA